MSSNNNKINPEDDFVISGLGVVAPLGIGKDNFWHNQFQGLDTSDDISGFPTDDFSVNKACQVKDFNAKDYLGRRGLRNLDKGTLFLLVATKQAIEDAKLEIAEDNTDKIGVCTGTTFSHCWPIFEFDKEVFNEGLKYASPGLFPSTVLNAASSAVSIRYNIQGFNTTVSTGYTSSLAALEYSLDYLRNNEDVRQILVAGVDSLNFPLFFGFHKLGYLAGINGENISCPFDNRRNGPMLGEGSGVLCIERREDAQSRGAPIYARLRSVSSFFDGFKIGKIHPKGAGFKRAVFGALVNASLDTGDIDYISSCANSSLDLDAIEAASLQEIFKQHLDNAAVSSIKSMTGETFSAAGILQIISSIGAMHQSMVPPTINFREEDSNCSINCTPNQARAKEIENVLVSSFGPGGYNSACVIAK
jgi:3-oxoacyl-[acyl-carrier-protein] synthase II